MVLSAQSVKQAALEIREKHGTTSCATATLLSKAGNFILVQAQVENIWYTLDGSNPNPTGAPPKGFMILAGAAPDIIPLPAGSQLTVIGEAGGARLQFQWLKG